MNVLNEQVMLTHSHMHGDRNFWECETAKSDYHYVSEKHCRGFHFFPHHVLLPSTHEHACTREFLFCFVCVCVYFFYFWPKSFFSTTFTSSRWATHPDSLTCSFQIAPWKLPSSGCNYWRCWILFIRIILPVLKILDFLKSTILRSFRDRHRHAQSYWVRENFPEQHNLEEMVMETVSSRWVSWVAWPWPVMETVSSRWVSWAVRLWPWRDAQGD